MPEGTGLAVVFVVVEIALAWAYRDAFRPLFARRQSPLVEDARRPPRKRSIAAAPAAEWSRRCFCGIVPAGRCRH